jgi:hypothetical protein
MLQTQRWQSDHWKESREMHRAMEILVGDLIIKIFTT